MILRLLLFFIAILPSLVEACQVPVFRYALERWEADPYQLTIYHRGEATPTLTETINTIRREADNSNLAVETLDLESEAAEAIFDLPDVDESLLPWSRLTAPEKEGLEPVVWEGPASLEHLSARWRSPLRQKIVQELTSGTSAAWILVEGADPEENDGLEKELEQALDKVTPTLKISDQVVPLEEAGRVASERATPLEMDDVLRSRVPLKISFAHHRLSRDQAGESGFLDPIRTRFPDRWATGQPLLFPVFGRGRILDVIPGTAIGEDTIAAACRYLCGACSCQVKSENPGMDLLIEADWASVLDDQVFVVEREAPPLEGVGSLLTTDESVPSPPTPPEAASVPSSFFKLATGVGLVLVLVVVVAILGSWIVTRRS
ncbi:MAG: hypothetical protein AAF514_02205 [Verrucomicrobiota bacterium]